MKGFAFMECIQGRIDIAVENSYNAGEMKKGGIL